MSDGLYKGHELYYYDLPTMILDDIAELNGFSRSSSNNITHWDEAMITTIQCKHCKKAFVPEEELWICFYCGISNL